MKFLALLLPGFLLALTHPAPADSPAPQWIWATPQRESPAAFSFSHTFSLATSPDRAILRVAGDFCGLEVRLNGHLSSVLDPFDPSSSSEVKHLLHQGENRIDILAHGTPGPSAFAVQIDAAQGPDLHPLLISGPLWSAHPIGKEDKAGPVTTFGPLGAPGWNSQNSLADIGAFDEYNQWKEALGASGASAKATFSHLPDGFAIDLLHTAADTEGSWVSMAFDPEGRILIAREDRGILRATLAKDRNSLASLDLINDSLLECRGLLFAHGSLYANANNSKALFRLRDPDGDGSLDEVTELKPTAGGVGHGRNDLALGPDGLLYLIHGDSVEIPPDSLTLTPPTQSPPFPEGNLVRTDPDGKNWEIVAVGLRNPFGIDFHPDGEPFTYDADNENDIGLPFYRPTRVNHLVSGADYGWRQGGRSSPVYAPESLPSNLDIGHGSPTAVKFGTRSNFPERYRNALFVLDWAYGRILAVDTFPRGASYTCQAHTFLRGRPLNVTDLDFGPDGAMYFVTGGRKTRSALYRVRYSGPAAPPATKSEQESACATFSASSRALRRSLEKFHRSGTPETAIAKIWPELGNPDPWIRHAARIALEHQPGDRWLERALSDPPSSAATLTALLALARVAPDSSLPQIHPRLAQADFKSLPRHSQLTLLRTLEISRTRNSTPDEPTSQRILAQIAPAFPAHHPDLNRELAHTLLTLGHPEAIPKSLDLLAHAATQPDQLFYLDALSRAAAHPAWTIAQRETFFRFLTLARTFDGDLGLPGFVNAIRDRALAALSDSDRTALATLISPDAGTAPDPSPPAPHRPHVKNWTPADLASLATSSEKPSPESLQRGKEIFSQAQCVRCHQIGPLGTPVGPNLTAAAARYSRADLLGAILEPSSVIAEIYQIHAITKSDGTVLLGRIIRNNLRDSSFTLAPDPFAPWNTVEISKNDIASRTVSPASPMPAGLLDTFSPEEIRDLLAFIESGGTP